MTIKHLVISGGGPIMIQILGAIQHFEEHKYINIDEIESIYGTSAGAIVGILICLKFDWNTIYDYIIKRPWHEVFKINVEKIFEAYTKKGIFDAKVIEKCFKPLFDAKDLSLNITLEEFYHYSKIELHLFTFEINEFQVHDISYLTHPKLTLLTAVQMTCSLPILLSPVCIENKCYIDGGMICNYPLKYCIESGKNINEILGFKNKYNDNKSNIYSDSTLLDFIMGLLFKIIYSFSTSHIQPTIQNEIICNTNLMSIDILKNALSDIEVRKNLFDNGIKTATDFLSITKLENSIQELSKSSL